jgi:hypothetical protein
MKTGFRVLGKSLLKLGLVAAAGCIVAASPACAQGGLVGKFTLPYEVRWGKTLLHAGTYNYSIEPLGVQSVTSIQASPEPVLVTVRGEQGGPATLLLAMASQRAGESDASGLAFVSENGERTVRSLSVDKFGIIVRFKQGKAAGEVSAKDVRKLPTVSSAKASL